MSLGASCRDVWRAAAASPAVVLERCRTQQQAVAAPGTAQGGDQELPAGRGVVQAVATQQYGAA
eukprot:1158141-Pelagomonas_calceolata.AAC.3